MGKNRKFKNKPLPVAKSRTPVFKYTSVCCEAPANKPPVQRNPADIAENKFSECHLGKWHCTKCEHKCKVKRSKFKEETPSVGSVGATEPANA